jgi:hypothetical protein
VCGCDQRRKMALYVMTLAGGKEGYADGMGESARFSSPTGIAIDGEHLYVSDTKNRCIRYIDKLGNVSTIAGNAFASPSKRIPKKTDYQLKIENKNSNSSHTYKRICFGCNFWSASWNCSG